MPLLKIDRRPGDGVPARDEAVQIAGSFTRRCTQSVKSAGRIPMKNTARQP